ncbi:hypothetical protein A3I40_03580 [Candidatus Uhrbacteria bacterium RIFCSPLOWO2_02_FULL_48_12]|uniref:Glycosyl transferase family 1 domain-containing protein n=1 Tax=Candidatus Uhrbacteria bacterium RIFCSPLOWO2_02_FULL_48_12 TaxID=1802407 RepID=A0A1F7VB63_9BACT|nr:MAG: hypothetical protein A3I40_03580 [Candidatus Uhrbacteria bacterium RIFCSPLOWO2_02_FULL_48_12]
MGKILLLTLEYPPSGGVGRMYRELARAMPPERIVVWAAPSTAEISPDAFYTDNYTIRRSPLLSSWGWPRWLVTIFRLDAYLEQQGIDQIIVGQVLPLGTAVWLLSLVRPLHYAVFVHGLDVLKPMKSKRKKWLIKKIFHRANGIFAANKFVAGLIKELDVPSAKITVIYPSPALSKFPNAALVKRLGDEFDLAKAPVLLTISRLVERKGHDVVLRALEIVWREVPDLRYFIIGDGPMRARLKILKNTLSRHEQVKFLGALDDDETTAWLSLAAIFIMTPRTLPNGDVEGLGIVYLEAGYAGKPVIGSYSGGVSEAIVDGETGLLVPENDIKATTAAILKLLHDPALAARMGAAGRKRALGFSARSGASKILEFFNHQTR